MSPLKIHAVSSSHAFINAFEAAFAGIDGVTWTVGDVTAVPREGRAFVSPANGFLVMDGGVDEVYSGAMFPGVEAHAQARLGTLTPARTTSGGRPYLPVGSAIAVPCGGTAAGSVPTYLVCAPTMFRPHDVSATRNAYHAFLAALCLAEKLMPLGVHTLVTTGLCCGYGRMPAERATAQMREAYDAFVAAGGAQRPAELEVHDGAFITEAVVEEQVAEEEAPHEVRTLFV